MTESSCCFQKCFKNSLHRFCIMVCPEIRWIYYIFFYTYCWELMKSVGSHGSLSLLFVMKVMVWNFVSNFHKVTTVLILMLPSLFCHGDSSSFCRYMHRGTWNVSLRVHYIRFCTWNVSLCKHSCDMQGLSQWVYMGACKKSFHGMELQVRTWLLNTCTQIVLKSHYTKWVFDVSLFDFAATVWHSCAPIRYSSLHSRINLNKLFEQRLRLNWSNFWIDSW
jgi:hypothetical protein